MNIKQAKEYIKQSVTIYLKKDEFSEYIIPVNRQRPIFLLGAPGLGKTAIMEQIAQELGVALVSYSMTHHTRQSALGLPFIKHCTYEGMEYDVTEYTMSEIISSIYETMKESGIKEGILFLDEINCVSETLSPSMLQFLQYKVFGRHKVPDGWVIVTAGNPPEYNKSVREFDVVVMDRLKVLKVEADYHVFKEYAAYRGVHPAIINFLDIKRDYFYRIENTVEGRSYVTARGWEDLSEILYLYENEKLTVSNELVSQYITNDKVVREFSAYYDLFNKYKKDYKISEILKGDYDEKIIKKAQQAPFDERLSIMGMLIDKIQNSIKDCVNSADYIIELKKILSAVKENESTEKQEELLRNAADMQRTMLEAKKKANSISKDEIVRRQRINRFLDNGIRNISENNGNFSYLAERYSEEVKNLKTTSENIKKELHELFEFCDKAFSDGNEMLVLVTELTVNNYSSKFIARFGSEDFKKHNDELMLSDRSDELASEIEELVERII